MLKKILFFAILSFLIPFKAFSGTHSTVVNGTDNIIAVVWTGLGCANIAFANWYVCKSILLKPEESHRYQYGSLISNKRIAAGKKIDYVNEFFKTNFHKYVARGNKPATSFTGNCQFPHRGGSKYTITDMEVKNIKGIIGIVEAEIDCGVSVAPE